MVLLEAAGLTVRHALLHCFKYEDNPELAPSLAGLLATESQLFLSQAPSLVVALPLHARRFLERKCDQALAFSLA